METHLKKKHDSQMFIADGYSLFRRDSAGRRGSGVAVYLRNCLKASILNYPGEVPDYELMWVKVETASRDILVGALYHPPKPIYQPSALLEHLENCIDELTGEYPRTSLVLAGDFNSQDNDDIISQCALNAIVDQPTRGV